MEVLAPGDVERVAGAETESSSITRAPAVDLVFLPGDPPREGTFAAYIPFGTISPVVAGQVGSVTEARAVLRVPNHGADEYFGGSLQVVCPAPRALRRVDVRAHHITIGNALAWLVDLEDPWRARPSVAAWSCAVVAGLGFLARGRLFPAVTPNGWDAWRAGPFDAGDQRLLENLAASLPPAAHCISLGMGSPMRVMSPTFALRALWDAIADTLVRSEAAPLVAGGDLFAARRATEAEHLAAWLDDSGPHPEGNSRVGLRVVLDAEGRLPNHEESEDDDRGEEVDVGSGPCAVVQMTSTLDPSLVIDAGDLLTLPMAVTSRLDPDAEANLLLALRRGSRVWPPLAALLTQRIPAALPLSDDEIEELLGDGGEALRAMGIEVLWPSSLLFEGLTLHGALRSPPADETDGTFSLDEMVKFDWRLALRDELLSAEDLEHLAEAKRSIVRLRGKWVHVDLALIERARHRRERKMSAIEALAAAMAGHFVVDGETIPVVVEGSIASFAQRLREIADGGVGTLGKPPGLAGELRPYQERGIAWLHHMCSLGLGGCLADDMGLGKTIQVIGLHLHRRAAVQANTTSEKAGIAEIVTTPRQPGVEAATTLVICPTSLLGNWARELQRFAPGVPVRRFYGPERTLDGLQPGEVVITTYGVARRDRAALSEARFSLVVADEAQHAKNPLSDTARSLRSIGGGNRIALTGTPVENRLSELWSILDWTTPGLLGPLERFRMNIALPVERRRDPAVTERFARTVRPFLLRRKKTDPAIAPDLPPRTVTDRVVGLTPEQVTLYEAEVREAIEAIRNKSGIQRQGLVFRMMTVLKQICNHPAHYLHQSGPIAGRSGKLAALEELLGVVLDEGDSTLVFSQYVEMCSLVEARLSQLGIGTVFLHGSVPVRRREEMVAEFQSGRVPVFLLSLKAGGVGLNLTKATHVIHYDRWWNPAVEDQATDRAHRIGQERPVQVHRLITEGTLEDRIGELLEKKRNLATAVVGEGEAWISEMSDGELADLVKLGTS
jgi:superfamily II DNA or RNA helicase